MADGSGTALLREFHEAIGSGEGEMALGGLDRHRFHAVFRRDSTEMRCDEGAIQSLPLPPPIVQGGADEKLVFENLLEGRYILRRTLRRGCEGRGWRSFLLRPDNGHEHSAPTYHGSEEHHDNHQPVGMYTFKAIFGRSNTTKTSIGRRVLHMENIVGHGKGHPFIESTDPAQLMLVW